jgi:hypothetical protein
MFTTRLYIKTEEIRLHSKHASSACWDYKKNYQLQTKIFTEKISSVNHLGYQYLYSSLICF